jgi:hypothetical protein
LKKFIKVFAIVLSLFLPLYALAAAYIAPPSGWPVTETQDLIVHNSSQESNITATTFSAATANITTETVGSSVINSLQSVAITAATANITSSTINTSNITNATITTESVTTSTINSLQASAITVTALSAKTYTTTVGGIDFSTSVGGYYITNAGGQNFVNFKNPSTPTPTTYSYNGFSFSIPASIANGNNSFFTWTASAGYNVPELQIIGNAGRSVIPYFLFETKDGVNGVNNGILRGVYLESYAGNTYIVAYNNSKLIIGSNVYADISSYPVIIDGAPTILTSQYANPNLVNLYQSTPFTVTSSQFGYASTGIGITMATNAGQGIYTQTQNNAIMNTGPIYPRNPANVAQTLTQPTIQPVYNNDLAGISYTGWSVTGSGNLSSGVLTVNLGLSFDNANAYKCSANYDGVPTTVAGFLAITRNSGSQFVITSVNSTGGTNTTDANKVQWTCIGY